jgi:hypothetical protein
MLREWFELRSDRNIRLGHGLLCVRMISFTDFFTSNDGGKLREHLLQSREIMKEVVRLLF